MRQRNSSRATRSSGTSSGTTGRSPEHSKADHHPQLARLHAAVVADDAVGVRAAIESGADVNAVYAGGTALELAMTCNRASVIPELHAADIMLCGPNGEPPLHQALTMEDYYDGKAPPSVIATADAFFALPIHLADVVKRGGDRVLRWALLGGGERAVARLLAGGVLPEDIANTTIDDTPMLLAVIRDGSHPRGTIGALLQLGVRLQRDDVCAALWKSFDLPFALRGFTTSLSPSPYGLGVLPVSGVSLVALLVDAMVRWEVRLNQEESEHLICQLRSLYRSHYSKDREPRLVDACMKLLPEMPANTTHSAVCAALAFVEFAEEDERLGRGGWCWELVKSLVAKFKAPIEHRILRRLLVSGSSCIDRPGRVMSYLVTRDAGLLRDLFSWRGEGTAHSPHYLTLTDNQVTAAIHHRVAMMPERVEDADNSKAEVNCEVNCEMYQQRTGGGCGRTAKLRNCRVVWKPPDTPGRSRTTKLSMRNEVGISVRSEGVQRRTFGGRALGDAISREVHDELDGDGPDTLLTREGLLVECLVEGNGANAAVLWMLDSPWGRARLGLREMGRILERADCAYRHTYTSFQRYESERVLLSSFPTSLTRRVASLCPRAFDASTKTEWLRDALAYRPFSTASAMLRCGFGTSLPSSLSFLTLVAKRYTDSGCRVSMFANLAWFTDASSQQLLGFLTAFKLLKLDRYIVATDQWVLDVAAIGAFRECVKEKRRMSILYGLPARCGLLVVSYVVNLE